MTDTKGFSRKADVLHVVEYQKFIPPFIALVNQYLDTGRHHFFFIRNGHLYTQQGEEIVTRNAEANWLLPKIFSFIRESNRADKIVLHGLFSSWLILVLFFQPWLLRRCYWIIWGGDLYNYANGVREGFDWIKEIFRRPVIRNFGHLVTYVEGDVKLARKWYGAKGEWHECIIYPSNTYQVTPSIEKSHQGLVVLIGNSADPSNNHAEIIRKVKEFHIGSIKVIAPLSYGPKKYALEIEELGKKEFGGDFIALQDFISYKDYLDILANVDIAVFNHRRQQGMGNVISLLGMGKTVAIRSDLSSWALLTSIGIVLRDTINIDLSPLPTEVLVNNVKIIKEKFSMQTLIHQLKATMES